MINNRQGGRRRGRGGGGGPPRSNNPGPGNRQDNRQRGNAAQLLEKYKGLARDAQMQGDRILTENYLQFADHYFRVLNENRARFEEQRPRQRDDYQDDYEGEDGDGGRETNERYAADRDDDVEDEGDEELVEAEAEGSDEQPEREEQQERGDRFSRRSRPRRGDGDERSAREESDSATLNGETIPFDALPPAIGRDEGEASAEEEPRRPRRRSRGQRPPEGDEEVAPAA